jgi:DNA-binding transcriptional ArsR family regulator
MAALADAPPDLLDRSAEAAALLRLLGNERRLLAACHLAEHGEMQVGALADLVGLSMSALSQHLALLREAGVVEMRRHGQAVFYRLADPRAAALLGLLHEIYCRPGRQGEPC